MFMQKCNKLVVKMISHEKKMYANAFQWVFLCNGVKKIRLDYRHYIFLVISNILRHVYIKIDNYIIFVYNRYPFLLR